MGLDEMSYNRNQEQLTINTRGSLNCEYYTPDQLKGLNDKSTHFFTLTSEALINTMMN